MIAFNLVTQPWIPVTAGGEATRVSLLEAVTRSHEIDGLGLEDPLQAVAVFRQVLLPVVLDALGVPRSEEEWVDRWQVGRLEYQRLADYLEQHSSRFDLFDAKAPFAQVAGLHTAKLDVKPISMLLPSVASGNNVPLFSGLTDGTALNLSAAEAACAVLSAQCWDTAAIKSGAVGDPRVKAGKTTGNPTGPVGALGVTIPMGENLAQTLLLNTPVLRQGLRPSDAPQWRVDPVGPGWEVRPARGLLDLLTFQARRIRLVPDTDSGEQPSVSRVVLSAGDRLAQIPEYEPHTMWRVETKPAAGAPPRRPVRHRQGRSAWQGLTSLLATRSATNTGMSSTSLLEQLTGMRLSGDVPDTLSLQVLTVGVAYGNQSAVVEDVMVDLIPLPVVALIADAPVRQLLLDVVADAEAVQRAGNILTDDVRRAGGGDPLPWDKSLRLGDALIYQLGGLVRRLLGGLQRNPELVEQAALAWTRAAREMSLAAGEEALSAAPPQTFLGRRTEDGRHAFRLSTAEAHYRAAVFARFPRPAHSAVLGGDQ